MDHLLDPPLTALPCFQHPDLPRHVYQVLRHGIAGRHGSRLPGLLDQRLLKRLVIGSPPPSQAVPDGVTTIIASTDPAARPGSGVCVVSDEDVPRAYAIIAGLALPEVSTAQFLIDGDGWLRSLQRPGVAPGWNDPAVLAQAVAAIRAHPLSSMGAGSAPMRM